MKWIVHVNTWPKEILKLRPPTKSFCNQVNKSKKKVKLQYLLQERKLTPEEQLSNQNQKQYIEIFCQNKIKNQVRDCYANLYNHRPTSPNKEEILESIGVGIIKTLTPNDLEQTEKKNFNGIN